QLAEAGERPWWEGIMEPLDAAVRLEAEIHAIEVLPHVVPERVELAAARPEDGDLEVRGSIRVRGRVGVDVSDRPAHRPDLEEIDGAAVDEAGGIGREFRRDVLHQRGVSQRLALTGVVSLGCVR